MVDNFFGGMMGPIALNDKYMKGSLGVETCQHPH